MRSEQNSSFSNNLTDIDAWGRGKKDVDILELVRQEKDQFGFRVFFKSWALNLGFHIG